MPGNGCAVIPHATRQQVQALQTEVTALRRKLAEVVEVPDCSICLDAVTYPVELQDCRHLYCCQCLYKHVNSNAVGSRACPLCRCRIRKAPLAVPTCFNELLERLKKEKERQEQEAAGGGKGGGAETVREQNGKKRKKGGGPVAGLGPSGAGAILGEGPVVSEDEERRHVNAAFARVSAAQVAHHTYNSQMDDMSVMFEIERQRRDRVQQRRGARAGGGEGEEEEEVEEGVILYYAREDMFWCPLCGFEVEDDQAHTCGDEVGGEEEDGEEEEAHQGEVGAGLEGGEHEPQPQQQEQEQEEQEQQEQRHLQEQPQRQHNQPRNEPTFQQQILQPLQQQQQQQQSRHDAIPTYQPTQLFSDTQFGALGMAHSTQYLQPSTEGYQQQQHQQQESPATAQHNQHRVLSPADRQATEEAAMRCAEVFSSEPAPQGCPRHFTELGPSMVESVGVAHVGTEQAQLDFNALMAYQEQQQQQHTRMVAPPRPLASLLSSPRR